VILEILHSHHQKQNFDCGNTSLNHYLHRQSTQDMRKNLTVCFVAAEGATVIGYFTLTAHALQKHEVSTSVTKHLPRGYAVPVILLGRLAIDCTHQGKGLGKALLYGALTRAFTYSQKSVGAVAVVTDPVDERAKRFYEAFQFVELKASNRLFLPMRSIQKWIRK
jgi:Predicted acetyltransferase